MARESLDLAVDTPKALFHENEIPNFLPIYSIENDGVVCPGFV
jgi:hypothetical protein